MKNLKKLLDKADNDVFDEIIKACEGNMVKPFKKEKTVVIEAEPEEEGMEMEAGDEESPKSKDGVEDLSPEDLEKLKELYASLKG